MATDCTVEFADGCDCPAAAKYITEKKQGITDKTKIITRRPLTFRGNSAQEGCGVVALWLTFLLSTTMNDSDLV